MRKTILALIILTLIGITVYWFFKMSGLKRPLAVESTSVEIKTNSSVFMEKTGMAMDAYLGMKDAFVEFDTAKVKMKASEFLVYLDSIPLDELKKDSANIYESALAVRDDIRLNIESLLAKNNITGMRRDFSMASDMLYPGFLKLLNYSGPRLYLQHCPMAFNDTEGANWISNSAEIMNPYLGRFDPKYKSGMLHCGEVMDSTGKR